MQKLVILGPTGIGKSAYALNLAKDINADIISVDSMQVYKYMDIGTAKLSLEERYDIPHFMIDIVEPSVQYSVADYVESVKIILQEHEKTCKNLVFCGGTGLYLNALFNGLSFPLAEKDEAIRAELEQIEKTNGKEFLWAELQKVDPEAAGKIHPNDSYRSKRALEVFKITGQKFSEQSVKKPSILGEDYKIIGLTTDRISLNKKVEQRVDKMLEQGLVKEVQGLLERGYQPELSSMQAIGYKEMVEYLQNKCALAEAVENIKMNTRRLVKKQYTWFRAFKNIEWKEI